jgi:hypothetical protein
MKSESSDTNRLAVTSLIKRLHEEGRCPRLVVNALHPDVQVPDELKEQWGQVMPIDLDPAYPLELQIDAEGVSCTLSFQHIARCVFPWAMC